MASSGPLARGRAGWGALVPAPRLLSCATRAGDGEAGRGASGLRQGRPESAPRAPRAPWARPGAGGGGPGPATAGRPRPGRAGSSQAEPGLGPVINSLGRAANQARPLCSHCEGRRRGRRARLCVGGRPSCSLRLGSRRLPVCAAAPRPGEPRAGRLPPTGFPARGGVPPASRRPQVPHALHASAPLQKTRPSPVELHRERKPLPGGRHAPLKPGGPPLPLPAGPLGGPPPPRSPSAPTAGLRGESASVCAPPPRPELILTGAPAFLNCSKFHWGRSRHG